MWILANPKQLQEPTTVNENDRVDQKELNRKRRKTSVINSQLGLVLHLGGQIHGTSFLTNQAAW